MAETDFSTWRSLRAVFDATGKRTILPSIFQSKNDPEIDFRFQYKMILKT